jgi:hypothetical protein
MASVLKLAGRGVTSGATVDWTNPNNITSSNNVYATALLSAGADTIRVSDFLRADQFAFDIPAIATIDGIVCSVERKASAASAIRDYAVQMLKNGSVPVGSSDKKDLAVYWSITEGTVSYGSPTDLWNATWTPSDINNSTTGFTIRCDYIPGYSSATASVDAMSMTVHYTVDGIKFGSTSISRAYYGSTEIKAVYYGSTQIA